MAIPDYRIDYTETALEVYEMARRQWLNNQDFKYKGIPLKWK